MKNIIVISFLIFSAVGFSSVEDLKNDKKGLLELEQTLQSMTSESWSNEGAKITSNYRVRKIGKKFVGVFDKINRPLAIFDLSLNALSWKEIVVGAFKVRDFNLKGTVKNIYCARKVIKQNARREEGKKVRLKFCEESEKFRNENISWKEMRMTQSWANRQQKTVNFSSGGFEFFHSDFNLSEIVFDSDEERDFFHAPYIELFKILHPGQESLSDEGARNFLAEFEFRFNSKTQEYSMVWNREKRERKKKVKLPGVLVNFMSPVSPYAYRRRLMQIDAYADILKYRWYPYGPVMAAMIYRVTDKLVDRVNYHESQLISLLEATQAYEYEANYPKSYVNTVLNLLYLPRSNPSHMGSGGEYRKLYRGRLEINKRKILKKLKKVDEISLSPAGTGKFLIERETNEETGELEFKGIISTSNKPMWITGLLSRHVSSVPHGLKNLERFMVNTAGYLAKAFLRTWVAFRLGPINFSFSVPRDTWQRLIRLRHEREIYLEGQLAGLLDEAIRGKYDFGLTQDEAVKARRHIALNYMNPYETHIDNEEDVIAKNMKLLMDVLNGEEFDQMDPDHFLPMSL